MASQSNGMGSRGRFADSRPTRIRLTAWKLQPAGTFIVYRRPRTPREGGGDFYAPAIRPGPIPLRDRIVANQRLALKSGLINKSPAIGGVPNRLLRRALSPSAPPAAARGTGGMITVLFPPRERDRACKGDLRRARASVSFRCSVSLVTRQATVIAKAIKRRDQRGAVGFGPGPTDSAIDGT